MAAGTRIELSEITLKEWAKLEALIESIDDGTALAKDDDDTSIKDVIAHRAHWIELFFGWYADGLAGKEVAFPAPGYKWNELKRYNAELRAQQAGLGWDQARELLARRHAALVEFIEHHTDEELYGSPMAGANNDWTTGRWVEATGPSHYRSAAKYVRAALRRLQD